MRISHLFPSTHSQAEVSGQPGFLLRNQIGDLLSFYPSPQSRYEGWYLQKDQVFFKILERIEVLDSPLVGMINHGSSFSYEYANGTRLNWKLTPTLSGLSLSLTEAATLRISLDIRPMYQQPGMGRQYRVVPEDSGCLVSYQDPYLTQPLFVHLRCTPGLELTQQWQEQAYPRDQQRHSPPDSLYIFQLGQTTTTRLGLGAGWSAPEARASSLAASILKPAAPSVSLGAQPPHTLLNEVTTAKAAARQALRLLQTEQGVWAGLPWFSQVWTRDDLISALGYNAEEQRPIIEHYLGLPLHQGELPTFQHAPTTGADGVGWLCLLVQEYGVDNLSLETKQRLLEFLEQARVGLTQQHRASHGLIYSGHNQTWMDTIGREGFRLEIQCMYALLLQILYTLTEEPSFEQERLLMLSRIRQFFWQQNYLADGLGDDRLRANLFLAYLLQPDLLSESSWQRCFDTALNALRTPWGGLTTLNPSDPAFLAQSTGEDNRSYHNGDSWFFINNLAAIALHRFNQRRFGKVVVEILQASTQEILWHNLLGQPGEISSASELDSFGCGLQAFSAGTYLALLKELESIAPEHSLDQGSHFWDRVSDAPEIRT